MSKTMKEVIRSTQYSPPNRNNRISTKIQMVGSILTWLMMSMGSSEYRYAEMTGISRQAEVASALRREKLKD